MASRNPVERAASLGGAVAVAPLRLVGGLASPARGGMARNVRRAIGISEQRPAIATDPDEAYLAPDGVARLVHADLPSMLIGGVTALLLQMLHPLAMAGVAEHSGYREDPLGRLRRGAGGLDRRAPRLGPPRARAFPRRAPRPLRRLGGRDAARPRALRRRALDGGAARLSPQVAIVRPPSTATT